MNRLTGTSRTALAGATATSAVAALLGLGWLLLPATSFFYSQPSSAWLSALAGPLPTTVVHTVAALTGVAVGLAALARAVRRHVVVAGGVVQLLCFGVLLQSMGTLSIAGYLVAMAMPVVLAVLLVQVVRRYPVARWLVGVPALVAAVVGVVLGREALAALAATLGAGLAAQAPRMLVALLLLLVGTSWAAAVAAALAGTPGAARATAWVTRHRTVLTVVAACGPLPYAVLRLSWLLPSSLVPPALAPEGLDLSMRIWGLLLSSGAWLGSVLTLGLVRPWGEVFPRWVPGLAGRPVPVAAAAVPGGLVAAVLCFTAVPMLFGLPEGTVVQVTTLALVFPCWLWGPALALAVWGYVGHRRQDAAASTPAAPDAPAGDAGTTSTAVSAG
ncbi:hypothetical protein GC722_03655 [Auraticoccus sp. F435]|uniref:Uncharacterized protein n=1 Tax=Auraticoccus cholistanensis TaxID=2656650 RepID=A0A6A9UV90_9ACTN|nr:hypothetical protein [Auraticoccus cholistanensis]MVA75127.1 hypothetical protein [Auraticoccus cholistanensis]